MLYSKVCYKLIYQLTIIIHYYNYTGKFISFIKIVHSDMH